MNDLYDLKDYVAIGESTYRKQSSKCKEGEFLRIQIPKENGSCTEMNYLHLRKKGIIREFGDFNIRISERVIVSKDANIIITTDKKTLDDLDEAIKEARRILG